MYVRVFMSMCVSLLSQSLLILLQLPRDRVRTRAGEREKGARGVMDRQGTGSVLQAGECHDNDCRVIRAGCSFQPTSPGRADQRVLLNMKPRTHTVSDNKYPHLQQTTHC